MSERAGHPTSIWLDDETRDVLDALAQEHGTSRSAVIRMAIYGMKANKEMAHVRKLVNELSKAVTG